MSERTEFDSLSRQIEMLAERLRTAWSKGERATVESFQPEFEQCSGDDEQLLDLIYHEVLIREEFGDHPCLDEYLGRFPAHAERLQRLFAVHQAIESEWDADALAVPEEDASGAPGSSGDTPVIPLSDDEGKRARRLAHRLQPVVDAPSGFKLLEELGRGGMAVVYQALQQSLNRVVALKMILGGAIAGPEVLARFKQEAWSVAQLQHPGIVQVYEVGEHRGLPFLSLEFVAGGTLQNWLRGRPLSPTAAARLIEEVARTTHFAHDKGIVHRDLKPGNLLLVHKPHDDFSDSTVPTHRASPSDSSGKLVEIKIADFGLARMLGTDNDLTATGQIIGTPSYMAPEQARGATDHAGRVLDVYSLGAILYELLTGHPPFRGATLIDTLDQVCHAEPVSPRRVQPRVPRDLETICLKCLEKAPERRYASALALAEDLARFQKGQTITARPVRWPERVWKWMRRAPAIAAMTAAVVLFAIAGVVGIVEGARRAKLSANEANQSARDAKRDRDEAIRLRNVAETERREAERLRRLAEEEQARAALALTRAEANFQKAMGALESLTRLGRQLRSEPRQQATSRRIFDETLAFYEGLLNDRADDPKLKFIHATALSQAGHIRGDMGDRDKAQLLLDRSAAMLDELIVGEPANEQYLHTSANVHWLRARMLAMTQHYKAADEAYCRCLAIYDGMLARRPGDPVVLTKKANTILNRCVSLRLMNRMKESLEEYAAATEILRELVRTHPDNDRARRELSLCLDDFGKVSWFNGDRAAAESLLRESLALREQMLLATPQDIGTRIWMARSLLGVALCEEAAGKPEAAAAMRERGVGLVEPLLKDFPEIYEYHLEVHNLYSEQYRAALLQKGMNGANAEWTRLERLMDQACKTFPKDPYFLERRAGGKFLYAFVFWETQPGQGLIRLARGMFPEPSRNDLLPVDP